MTKAQEGYTTRILKQVGAFLTDGHFVLSSWEHSDTYIDKDALYPRTMQTASLCDQLATKFSDQKVEVVVSPEGGSITLSQRTAGFLSKMGPKAVLAVYADEVDDDKFVLKRGYDKLVAGKRVLVVDDNLSTGETVRKVAGAVREVGGNIIGVGVLCNRGGVTAEELGVPVLEALLNLNLQSWGEEVCPLCKSGVPINTEVGHGKEFLEKKKQELARTIFNILIEDRMGKTSK